MADRRGLRSRRARVRVPKPRVPRVRRPRVPRFARFAGTTGRRRLLALAALALVAAASATAGALVGSEGEERAAPALPPRAGAPTERTSFLAKIIPPAPGSRVTQGPGVPRGIRDLVRRLPVERKVAQLFLFGFRGKSRGAVIFRQLRRLDLGGIVIDRPNYAGPGGLASVTGYARSVARRSRHLPPWILAPQEGGEHSAFPDLPPRNPPADLPSADAAGRQAAEAGRRLRGLGVTGVLGPVIDVGLSADPSLGTRVYSDDPEEVAAFAEATTQAYNRAGVFAAVSHFPGLGTASQSTGIGPATVGLTLPQLQRRDLVPFRAAFAVGAPGVVLSHALYSLNNFTVPGSLSREVAAALLRRRLGFDGVAITDDLADPPITAILGIPDAAVQAVQAGADMVFISGPPGDQQAAYVAVLRAVRRGQVSRARLDEGLVRILLAKRRYGLIVDPRPAPRRRRRPQVRRGERPRVGQGQRSPWAPPPQAPGQHTRWVG